MKYTKKDRENAALICAIAASSKDACPLYREIQRELAASDDAGALAHDAWRYVRDQLRDPFGHAPEWVREHDAEAESLLRTGWVPEK
jgi:hypothetical protein